MFKVAIVGGREYSSEEHYAIVIREIQKVYRQEEVSAIVSGGAMGSDTLAERFAHQFNVPMEIYPAEWGKYGKTAGFKRNSDIVREADVIFAFWNMKSSGTKDTVSKAKASGKPLYVVDMEHPTIRTFVYNVKKDKLFNINE